MLLVTLGWREVPRWVRSTRGLPFVPFYHVLVHRWYILGTRLCGIFGDSVFHVWIRVGTFVPRLKRVRALSLLLFL